jgi:hypothetical protein
VQRFVTIKVYKVQNFIKLRHLKLFSNAVQQMAIAAAGTVEQQYMVRIIQVTAFKQLENSDEVTFVAHVCVN